MTSTWQFEVCDLCGETAGTDFLELPHPDAPGGSAFLRRCSGCGLRRLWPRPGPEIISRYYPSNAGAFVGRRRSKLKQALWNLLRDGASGAPGRGRALRPLRGLFRLFAQWQFDTNVPLNKDPLPRIIDIGCGFGDLLLYWSSRGAETLGVDLDERAVRVGRSAGLCILHGELDKQGLPAESFDVAVLNHSLEHVPCPLGVLRETARILRPGGTIHLALPNGASTGLETEKTSWASLSFPIHFWFFDAETLLHALKSAGFRDVKLRTQNSHEAPSVPVFLRRLGQDLWRAFADDYGGDLIRAVATRD